MTQKMLTITALEFISEGQTIANGTLIQETGLLAGRSVEGLFASGLMQMGRLCKRDGIMDGRMAAMMPGVGRMDAVFKGDRFLLAKKLGVRRELFPTWLRSASR